MTRDSCSKLTPPLAPLVVLTLLSLACRQPEAPAPAAGKSASAPSTQPVATERAPTATDDASTAAQRTPTQGEAETPRAHAWSCPMHPDVTAAEPGRCPQCGMFLTRADADHGDHDHAHAPDGAGHRHSHGDEEAHSHGRGELGHEH